MDSDEKVDFMNSFGEDEEDESEEEDDDVSDEPVSLTRKTHLLPCASPLAEKTGIVFLEEEEDDDVVSPLSISAKKPSTNIPLEITKRDPSSVVIDKKPSAIEESRKLFQRLWTDEDEIELLQGFLEYTTQRGSGHHDTSLFYDRIRGKLQLDFNKNQLVEKLRRLKKKYRNVLSRIGSGKDYGFKSAHEQTTFELSRKIWTNVGRFTSTSAVAEDNNFEEEDAVVNNKICQYDGEGNANSAERNASRSRKRSRGKSPEKAVPLSSSPLGFAVPGLVEETVKSCLSPLFKELVQAAVSGHGFGGVGAPSPLPMSLRGADMANEKWRKQQILELEVYSKRLELVQDEIKSMLQELRSAGG